MKGEKQTENEFFAIAI